MHLLHTKNIHVDVWRNKRLSKTGIHIRWRRYIEDRTYWTHYRILLWGPANGQRTQNEIDRELARGVASFEVATWKTRTTKSYSKRLGWKKFFRIKIGFGSSKDRDLL